MFVKFMKSKILFSIVIGLAFFLIMPLLSSSCSKDDGEDIDDAVESFDDFEDLEETTTEADTVDEIYESQESQESTEDISETEYPSDGEVIPYETLVETDVVYKTVMDTNGTADLKLDIYYPTNRIYYNNPTVVAFHGGAWIAGNRSDIVNMLNPVFDRLRENGYTVVTVQYRYASDVIFFPSNLEDCIDAILFLKENRYKYNIDIDSMGVAGYSAGAHLAMMCTYAMKTFSISGDYVDMDYCVSFAGPTKMYEDDASEYPRSILYMLDVLFNGSYEEKTDDYKMGSPHYYLNESTKTPLMLIQGDKDEIVPYNQSVLMFNRATELNIPCEFITLENGRHSIDLRSDMTSPSADELIESVEQFIYSNTSVSSPEEETVPPTTEAADDTTTLSETEAETE